MLSPLAGAASVALAGSEITLTVSFTSSAAAGARYPAVRTLIPAPEPPGQEQGPRGRGGPPPGPLPPPGPKKTPAVDAPAVNPLTRVFAMRRRARYSRSRMRLGRRLLILDDDTELVDAVARHLERHGYSPTRTYMVAEAAAAIDQSVRDALPFQAIVTDLQLPDGDGRAIVRLARERLP